MTENSKVTFKLGRFFVIVGTVIALASAAVFGYADIQNRINLNTEYIKEIKTDQSDYEQNYNDIINHIGILEGKMDMIIKYLGAE